MSTPHFFSGNSHRTALFSTVAVFLVAGGVVALTGPSIAATKSIAGRGVARSGAGADSIPVDFILTSPVDEKLNGERGELRISSGTKVTENIGQTTVGGALQPVKTKRVRPQNVTAGSELTFKGKYTVGGKDSVQPDTVTVHDRSFALCGKLQGITRRTAAGANEDTLTVEVSKRTVQEKRYDRFFPIGKDALLTFKDGTQFHNANGSWTVPKNRVSIQAADVTANQQVTSLRGKVTGNNTLELTAVDLGVKCS